MGKSWKLNESGREESQTNEPLLGEKRQGRRGMKKRREERRERRGKKRKNGTKPGEKGKRSPGEQTTGPDGTDQREASGREKGGEWPQKTVGLLHAVILRYMSRPPRAVWMPGQWRVRKVAIWRGTSLSFTFLYGAVFAGIFARK